jgi:hypothetical protein
MLLVILHGGFSAIDCGILKRQTTWTAEHVERKEVMKNVNIAHENDARAHETWQESHTDA